MEQKNLILGVGNEILMDDGIGPKLVEELKQKEPIPGTTYQAICLGGLDIVESIQGYQTVVFVDAIKTEGGVPGTVYQFTTRDFQETLHLSNLHDISFLTAIELGRNLDMEIPENIHIIAIEIVEDTIFGESFTPDIEARYAEIYNTVSQIVQRLFLSK